MVMALLPCSKEILRFISLRFAVLAHTILTNTKATFTLVSLDFLCCFTGMNCAFLVLRSIASSQLCEESPLIFLGCVYTVRDHLLIRCKSVMDQPR